MSMIAVKEPVELTEVSQVVADDSSKTSTTTADDQDKIKKKSIKGQEIETTKIKDVSVEQTLISEPSKVNIEKPETSKLITKNKKSNKMLMVKKKNLPKSKAKKKKKLAQIIKNISLKTTEEVLDSVTPETEPPKITVKPIENLAAFQESGEFDSDLFKTEEVVEDVPLILPKRRSFNLLDKIRSRLEESQYEESQQEQIKNSEFGQNQTASHTVVTEDIDKPSCSYKSSMPTIQIKSIINEQSAVQNDTSTITKNTGSINNIIERLQGKPNNVDIVENSLDEKLIIPKTEDVVLQVGPITATKRIDNVLYSCNISSCSFSTIAQHEFLIHCTNFHEGYPWNRFCNVCDAMLEHCGFEITHAYNHLVSMHLVDEIQKEQTFIASSDQGSNKLDSTVFGVLSNSDLPFKIVSVETEKEPPADPHDFPFCLTDFRTVSPDESETSDAITSEPRANNTISLAVISTAPVSGTVTNAQCSLVRLPLLTTVKNSPPPPSLVPITKTTLPALVPVSKTSPLPLKMQDLPPTSKPSKRILLRDTPLQNEELLKDRKSTTALTALLTETKLAHLYKCPEFNCVFSTDSKRSFIGHLSQHSDIPRDMQVPCLYCNYKTEFANIAIHYDIRHAKCTFCCIYCLYRAVNQPYVEMHQDLKHPYMPKCVLVVPVNQDAMLSQASITLLPIRDVIPPFLCSCKKKFLLESDILKHAKTEHNGILTCGYCAQTLSHLEMVVVHMQAHNVYHHHCRYCVYGSTNTDDIYKHLSLMHFAHSPQIVMRRFDPKKVDIKTFTKYDYEDDELFNYLKIITHDYYAYYTPSARKEITTTPSQSLNRVSKVANINPKTSTDDTASSDTNTTKEALNQPARTNSPIVLNKLINLNTNLLDITALSTSEISKTSTSSVKNDSVSSNEPTIPIISTVTSLTASTEAKELLPTINTEKDVEEMATKDKVMPSVVQKKDIKSENINTTASESDISLENSLSEVMDLTLSDSGETHFSDLTAEESLFTQGTTKQNGLSGRDLFRCDFCKACFDLSREFKQHVVKCIEINNSTCFKPYKCAHCTKGFKNVNSLLEHLRIHGTDTFACSLCEFKAQNQLCVRQHMKSKHKVTSVTVMPVDRQKQDYDCHEFIIRPKCNRQKPLEGNSNSVINKPDESSTEKLMFAPKEIDLLPFRPIFPQDLGCSVCGYKTKVKANLLRHLQFHLKDATMPVPTTAPINPVPCLEKNEKMFDKMTNLSHSGYNSNTSRMSLKSDKKELLLSELTKEEQDQIPLFVPSTKRNVCGAEGCDYLCLDDNMFKCHLAALHGTETFYKCKHCEVVLSSDGLINVDVIIKHQKLHDLCLYKCKYCPYLYNVKHKVESHISDIHPDKPVNVVAVREMTHEPIDTLSYEREQDKEEVKETKPWRCGMCKYRCSFKSEIVTHISNKHELEEGQYKCTLCPFKSNTMDSFALHFESEHSGHTIDVIDVYYKVEEKPSAEVVFDTTPIWKLNRNSNYIRGIPLEGGKSNKKSPVKAVSVGIEKSIESGVASAGIAVAKGKLGKEKKVENLVIEEKPGKIKEHRRSTSSVKKFKELNEKESNISLEVIEIEDEAGETEKAAISADDVISLEEIEKMDPHSLLELNLSGKHGPYGRPFHKKYLCPRCGVFKTSVPTDIVNHLYKELGHYKFICTYCRLYGVTYNFLSTHSKNKHPMLPESIYPLTPDNDIEDYIKKVLAIQSRIMTIKKEILEKTTDASISSSRSNVSSLVSSSVVEEASSTTSAENETPVKPQVLGNSCPHCSYSCRSASDLRKHEKRHWLQKPLKCGHCDFEGVTNYEISVHSKRNHPNQELSIIVMPTPSTPTIQPILRKRKRRSLVPTNTSTSDSSVANESFQSSDNLCQSEVDDKLIYLCHYCRKRCTTQAEIVLHCNVYHATREPKYRGIPTSKAPRKHSVNYKCFYCDFIGTLDSIKYHFKMDHPTQNLSVYRYQCSYCSEYFRKLEKVKAHCKQLHGDENPEHLDIQINNEPKIAKEFTCNKCNLQYDQEQELLDHNKNAHLDEELDASSSNTNSDKETSSLIKTVPIQLESPLEEKKKYKCPECSHTSNSYPSITDHLRIHTKPSQCFYCNARFIYPAHVKTHCSKEHVYLPFKHITDNEAMKKLEALRTQLLTLENDEYVLLSTTKQKNDAKRSSTLPIPCDSKRIKIESTTKPTARKSTTQGLVVRETARKSTTQIIPIIELDDDAEEVEDEGFSYYGTQPDMEDLEDVKTSISLLDKMVTMNVKQFSSFVDIFPTVPVLNIFNMNSHL